MRFVGKMCSRKLGVGGRQEGCFTVFIAPLETLYPLTREGV
jgi:hypothetical protein